MDIIRIKINVTQVNKDWLFDGKKGKYLDLALLPNREPDQYGNHYRVVQDPPQKVRQGGVRGPIVGNAKIFSSRSQTPPARPAPPAAPSPAPTAGDDDVPF